MEKIAIFGSPGAGKTIFARKLGFIRKIKVFHLDRMFWQQDWKKEARDARIAILQQLVKEEQWIIEGTYLDSSEPRLKEADAIIFLDIHPFLCLLRVIKRHYEYSGVLRRDIPKGCTDKLTPLRVLKVLFFPLRERRKLEQILRNYESKEIIQLHSTKEAKDFLAKQGASSSTFYTMPQKLPVISVDRRIFQLWNNKRSVKTLS